jgi:hypothetical protein
VINEFKKGKLAAEVFYIVSCLNKIALVGILSEMAEEDPLHQIYALIGIQGILLLYIIIVRPFKLKLDMVFCLI